MYFTEVIVYLTMNNTTDVPSDHPDYLKGISQALTLINFVVDLWLLIALCRYSKLRRKSGRSGDNKMKILKWAACTPVIPLIRVLSTQLVVSIGTFVDPEKSDLGCEWAVDLSVCAYYAAMLSVYTFLWSRQRYIYTQPSMRHMDTRMIKFLSKMALLIMYVAGLALCVLFVWPFRYEMVAGDCQRRQGEVTTWTNEVFHYSSLAAMVTTQVIMFLLFVHPLLKFRHGSLAVNQDQVNRRLANATRQAALSTAVSSAAIFVSAVVASTLLPDHSPVHFSNAIYDVGLSIVVFSVVLSFERWTQILMSPVRNDPRDLVSAATSSIACGETPVDATRVNATNNSRQFGGNSNES